MSILIVSTTRNPQKWRDTLMSKNESLDIQIYPDIDRPEDVEFAISWKHPEGLYNDFPNLKVIASMGAGVDHILKDKNLPEQVRVTRIVDEQLTEDMSQFVLLNCLTVSRNLFTHIQDQSAKLWNIKPYQTPKHTSVGIMGYGVLGQEAGKVLKKNGFEVIGYANSSKTVDGIRVYGEKEQDEFLNKTQILVCLLPLTELTTGILNLDLFRKLKDKAYLINVARGEHLNEDELLKAIDQDIICGASLDVFREEPLPSFHPFWEHPQIQITPHIASITDLESVDSQLLENYARMKNGKALLNEVNTAKGY
ncbi:2-hydroxy acid dehydrogenase SerA-like protein [Psychroflexus torquis ATCC 700755]|uniref:2-hydroxy acid dehydrogenase SerA-like protein n=1 Tax=Psychroflexus torquis (strain ATCC 700755 / CIP 106069 / ACAM 623) TaxID=313595 RepID=K4IIW9_PSYTT|nr:glyoxylate/hydroxypyruvate reductase A [Psychroflexus torquis]AFU69783.1 2-hydroxy acid dehydrogenase SerA-like protein [Psychroflexus torquis ATCC 700755]